MDKTDSTWQTIMAAVLRRRLAQANLLVGSTRPELINIASKLAEVLLCKDYTACGSCQSCYLLAKQAHPDCLDIKPDKAYGPIKIDQIRAIQSLIYMPAQLAHNRVIIIHAADKMNVASANALLKILEEPPESLYFILIAEQISTVLPTILSRCQRWVFALDSFETNTLAAELITDILELHNRKTSLNMVSTKWASYEINELARELYSLTAEMIHYYFNPKEPNHPVYNLAKNLKPIKLYQQLDKLSDLIKSLNQNFSVNQALSLDMLFMGYL